MFPTPRAAPERLFTIDTDLSTGLTFFVSLGVTYAIHSHTAQAPCAKVTFDHLSPQRQPYIAWVYIPLTREDNIQAFGIRKQQVNGQLRTACFLVGSSGLGLR